MARSWALGGALAAVLTAAACATMPAPATVAPPPTGGTVDDPVIGVAYPFQLPTHCGIRAASFGGHWWLATAPTGTSGPVGPQYTAGTMTLLSPTDARFDYAGGAAAFTPTATPQPCQ